MSPKLARAEECERILTYYGPDDFGRISHELDKQFTMLHNRAEVLLGICGILISASVVITTGRLIGRGDFIAQRIPRLFLLAAGSLDIIAASIIVGGVLRVRWITQQPGEDVRAWVMSTLAYRDAKMRTYRVSIVLVLLAMLSYQTSVACALAQIQGTAFLRHHHIPMAITAQAASTNPAVPTSCCTSDSPSTTSNTAYAPVVSIDSPK
jgi:hypothetical protein